MNETILVVKLKENPREKVIWRSIKFINVLMSITTRKQGKSETKNLKKNTKDNLCKSLVEVVFIQVQRVGEYSSEIVD